MRVRLRPQGMVAQQATEPTKVQYASGVPWTARPGDWIVTIGGTLVEVLTDKEFRAKYEPIVEILPIPRALCPAFEALTGVGTTRSADELLQAVQRLAKIEIGGVKIDFTTGQLEELKHRATKRGYTVEQELVRIVDRIKDELFYRS